MRVSVCTKKYKCSSVRTAWAKTPTACMSLYTRERLIYLFLNAMTFDGELGEGGGCSEVKHHIQPSGLEESEWNSRIGRFDLEAKPTV